MSNNLPWGPLFTTERLGSRLNDEDAEFSSAVPEITVYGLMAIYSGDELLASVGDVEHAIWARSLLKPIQLLCQLPFIQEKFPKLKQHHYALMLSSHNGEPAQVGVLEEILDIALINENFLLCPSTYPLSRHQTYEMKRRGQSERSLYHPCSGKHLGVLLGLQAKGKPATDYLHPESDEYKVLRELLTWLCGEFPEEYTIDGCQMPNFALSAGQVARLYGLLARDLPDDLKKSCPTELKGIVDCWPTLRETMVFQPMMVGGVGRLDTRIMEGRLTRGKGLSIVAKEGADGLLAVGVEPTDAYPEGLGIYIKLASGYDPNYLESMVTEVLVRLGLGRLHLLEQEKVLSTHYHFELHQPART